MTEHELRDAIAAHRGEGAPDDELIAHWASQTGFSEERVRDIVADAAENSGLLGLPAIGIVNQGQ